MIPGPVLKRLLVKYFLPLLFLFFLAPVNAQQNKIDSLLRKLKVSKEDTLQMDILNELSKSYRDRNRLDSSAVFANKVIEVGKRLQQRSSSKEILRQMIYGYSNLAVIFRNLGKFPESLQNALNALKIRESIRDTLGIANSYVNMGNVYLAQKNYEEALSDYTKALDIFKDKKYRYGVALCYNNIGNVQKHLVRHIDALQSYSLSLQMFKEMKEEYGMLNAYNNIGTLKEELGEYDDALKNYEASLAISEKQDDQRSMAMTYANMAPILARQKKFKEANSLLKKAFEIILPTHELELIRNTYETRYEVLLQEGDLAEAFKAYSNLIQYKDSLMNEDDAKETVKIQMQYDFDKKQTVDSIQAAEFNIQQELKYAAKVKQQKYYTYGGIAAFLLMIVVAMISFRAFREKKRSNELIVKQKKLVEEKQTELLDSINYARRIQFAMIPSEKNIKKNIDRLKKK
jgi:tetratricopeptide (TPR) repeat protein